MNVTVYGDSILKGVLMENGRYIINRDWEKRFSDVLGIRLVNRSRFGCTIRKALDLIRRDSQKSFEAGEYAILELGGNDCDYDWSLIASDPARDYDCKTPPAIFREAYRQAIDMIRHSGRSPVLVTLPPIHSERYLRFICREGLPRENILAWLGDVDAIYRWQEKYSDMVTELSREEGTKLVDLRKAFLADGHAPEELLCSDGIHPSRCGQDVILRAFSAAAA